MPRSHPSFIFTGLLGSGQRFLPSLVRHQVRPLRLSAWMDEWIYGTTDHAEYLAKLGETTLARLRVGQALSGQVNSGTRLEPADSADDNTKDQP